jgi:hypothetical protein
MDTASSDLFHFGSPTPSLIHSTPTRPQFSLPPDNTQTSDVKLSTSQQSNSSKRWNSGSSDGSRKNVRTDGRSSASSASYQDRNARISNAKRPIANAHTDNNTKTKRPPAHYRHSTMSAKSFASTLIETPALHQTMASFPQTLEVSVEDEEAEAGSYSPDEDLLHDDPHLGVRHGGGKSQPGASSTTRKTVSEMKRRFENDLQDASDQNTQQTFEMTKIPSLQGNLYTPRLVLKADTFDTPPTTLHPQPEQVLMDVTSSAANKKQAPKEDLQGLGLGITCLKQEVGSTSWQADMKRLETSISEAESIGAKNVAGKCIGKQRCFPRSDCVPKKG